MNEMKNEVFNFIFVMAMRDAVMRNAFKGERTWLYESGICEAWKAKLKGFVDQCLEGFFDSQEKYNDAFFETAEAIIESINEYEKNDAFTFGNAQKLINMTMKYFYIATYANQELRERFKFCHCPMDGIMLAYVFKEKEPELSGCKTWFISSWSQEGNKQKKYPVDKESIVRRKLRNTDNKDVRYNIFQKLVTELAKGASPLEYDYKYWGNNGENDEG